MFPILEKAQASGSNSERELLLRTKETSLGKSIPGRGNPGAEAQGRPQEEVA